MQYPKPEHVLDPNGPHSPNRIDLGSFQLQPKDYPTNTTAKVVHPQPLHADNLPDRHPIPLPLDPESVRSALKIAGNRIRNLELWAHNLNLCPPNTQERLTTLESELHTLKDAFLQHLHPDYPPPPSSTPTIQGADRIKDEPTPPITNTKELESLHYQPPK
jgi:hypothetical protein